MNNKVLITTLICISVISILLNLSAILGTIMMRDSYKDPSSCDHDLPRFWFCYYDKCYRRVLMEDTNHTHGEKVCNSLNAYLLNRTEIFVANEINSIRKLESFWIANVNLTSPLCNYVSYIYATSYRKVQEGPCDKVRSVVCVLRK